MTAQTIERPVEAATATCTASFAWCQGECTTADPYHGGLPFYVPVSSFVGGRWVTDETTLRVRFDGNESRPKPLILIGEGMYGLTAAQARAVAADLLEAADELEVGR